MNKKSIDKKKSDWEDKVDKLKLKYNRNQVAKADIIKYDSEDDLAADKLKNAAATKKLAIFDAFEILKRIQEEKDLLEGVDTKINNTPKGFAESRSK